MYLEVCFWQRRMIHRYLTYAGVPGFTPPIVTLLCTLPLKKMDHTKILSADVLIPSTYLLNQMNRFVLVGY